MKRTIYLKKVKNPNGKWCVDFSNKDIKQRQECYFYANMYNCAGRNDIKCENCKYHYIRVPRTIEVPLSIDNILGDLEFIFRQEKRAKQELMKFLKNLLG